MSANGSQHNRTFDQQRQHVGNQANAGRDVVFNPPPAPSPLQRLHSIPAPKADFTGRLKELEQLRQKIQTGTAMVSGLHGMGGVGKTELARVLAHQLRDRYPDARIELNLAGATAEPLSPETALIRVIQTLDPMASQLPEDIAPLRQIYLSLLDDKRAIVLADDASGPEQVRALAPPARCLLLVTSRQQFKVEGHQVLRLGCLEEPEAVAFLLTICPRIGDHATGIAKLCGCLPLALRAAASYLVVNDDVRVEQYVQDLSDEKTRLQHLGGEGVEIEVEASLNLSYAKLDAQVARVFRALSVFSGSFDAIAEEAICQDPDNTLLRNLRRYSLVEFDDGTQRYRLHDLVRVFAAICLSSPAHDSEEAPARLRHAAFYCNVLSEANLLFLKGGDEVVPGLARFDRERDNVEAGQRWAAEKRTDDALAAHLTSTYPGAGAQVLDLRLDPRALIGWLQAALAAAAQLGDGRAQGVHHDHLGLAYAALGEAREAIKYHSMALDIHRETGDRQAEGAALGNLGSAYHRLGHMREAIEYYKQGLAIAREIGDKHAEAANFGNLGLACYDLGNTHEAIRLHEKALAIDNEIGNRQGVGTDLGNLGNDHYRVGEADKALGYYEQQLAVALEIGDRQAQGTAFGNLANVYSTLGDRDRAVECYEEQLAIARDVGDRGGEGISLWNWSCELNSQGRSGEAVRLAEDALLVFREIESPHAADVEKWLAARRKKPDAK